jgi:hypothetical protein
MVGGNYGGVWGGMKLQCAWGEQAGKAADSGGARDQEPADGSWWTRRHAGSLYLLEFDVNPACQNCL